MGHKAMVAYEVSKGVYNLHFSPWGADKLKLKDHIKNNKPFGGEFDGSEEYMREIVSNNDSKKSGGHMTDKSQTTKIKKQPKLKNSTIHEVASSFSYLYVEAFFIVSQSGETSSYVPIPYVGDMHSGVLVECKSKSEYKKIFSKTRTSPWNDIDNTQEWRKKVKKDFGYKVAEFSKINI